MSQANLDVVRAVYEDWIRGDYAAVFALFDPDIEWIPPPDVSSSGQRRGHEGVRRSMAGWMGNWDDYRFELRRLIDCGDDVLAEGWQRARGRASGVELENQPATWLYEIKGGKAVRKRTFTDRSATLEAAGVTE